jgi:Fe2+ or Zn2+ uptake regulation protein
MVRRSTTPIAARLGAAEEALREHGLPLTIQRRRLLEGFLGRKDHPSAETLYREIGPSLPGLSRATVYRTLEKLVEFGLAARLGHPGSQARYDPHVERHHHLVCDGCGAVCDYDSPKLDRLPLPEADTGFEVSDYTVQFRGLCAACRARNSARARRSRRSAK